MDKEQMMADNVEKKKTLLNEISELSSKRPEFEKSFNSERKELEYSLNMINIQISYHKKIQEQLSFYNPILKYQEFGNEYGETLEELENNKKMILAKIESMKSPEEKDWEEKYLSNLYIENVRENIGSYLKGNYRYYSDLPFLSTQYNLATSINEMDDPIKKEKQTVLYMTPFKDWEQDLIKQYILSYQETIEKLK